MLGTVRKLHEQGILGINRRNAEYTLRYNQRSLYPRVDDKLLTKQLAREANVAVPDLYGVIESASQVRNVGDTLKAHEDFVIKPCRGCGGEGILVIVGSPQPQSYRKSNGQVIDREELTHHIFNILGGLYSLGGHPDRALIEYRVKFDPLFKEISFQGIPDIRTVVFFGVPVMCMVRLPTQMSSGRANLHQGAVGAGIDVATGTTLQAVWRDQVIIDHPDTGNGISGLTIPQWDNLLHLAANCYQLTGIAYQGVDIVLDRDKGPLLLEVNARPGLNIQIANSQGLLPRLKMVEKHHHTLSTAEERIAFAQEHFANPSQSIT